MQRAQTVFFYNDVSVSDAQNIVKWLKNAEITQYLNEIPGITDTIERLSLSHADKHLLTYHFNKNGKFFMVSSDGEPIGFIKLVSSGLSDEYEIVIVIGEERLWGSGYGRAALKQCLHTAFFTLRAKKLTAKIHSDNKRSVHLFRNIGFRFLEKRGSCMVFDLTFANYFFTLQK